MKKILLYLLSALALPVLLLGGDPWEEWRKGFYAFEKGVRLKESGEYQRARAAFAEAVSHYESVCRTRPDWNQRVIQNRIRDSKKAIQEIDQLLTSSQLSGATGVSVSEIGALPAPASKETPAAAPAKPAEPVVSQAEYDKLALESERNRKRLLETLVELEDLRRELARNKANAEEIGNLLRERRVAEERYNLLQKRFTELEKQLKTPNSKIAELESKLLELQLSLDLEKKRAALLETKWKKSDEDALRQSGLFRAANERLTAAQGEIDKLSAQLSELRRARDAAAEENGRRDQELQRLRLALRAKEQQLSRQLEEMKKLQTSIESLRRGAVSKESVAVNLLEENKKLRTEATELRRQQNAAKTALEDSGKKIRSLQEEVLQLRENAQRSARQQEASAAELAALRKDLERERTSAKFIRTEVANWRERCRKLEIDVKEWSERSARFEERVKNLTSSNFNALEGAEREKKRLESEIASLTERFAVLQARGEQLEEQRKQLETLRAKDRELLTKESKKSKTFEDAAVRSAAEVQKLQKEVAGLQQKLSAAVAASRQDAALRSRLQELNVNFQALRSENAKLKEQLNTVQTLYRNLSAAQNQAGSLTAVQKDLIVQQRENQLLRDQLLALQNQLQTLKLRLKSDATAGSGEPSPAPAAPRRAAPGTVKDLIAAGLQAEKEEKHALAVWNYEMVLEVDPSNAEGAMRLGMLQLKRQLFSQAEKYLALARSLGRDEPALRIAHATALNGVKRYGNALEVLSPLLKSEKETPPVELVLPAATAYLGAGKHAQAEALLRAAIQRNPEAPSLKRELARILVRTERNAEALELYRRARELGEAPDKELETALGKLLEERRELNNFMASAAREAEKAKDWLSAAWYYRQMLDQEKRSSVLAAHLAFAQLQSKNPAAAIETLTMNPPPSALGSLIMALAYFKNGDPARAVEAAKQVVSLNGGRRLEIVLPEWQSLKSALEEATARPEPKMADAAKKLKAAFY